MFDFKKNIIKPLQSFFCKKKNIEKEKEVTDEISDFDYLQLTEIHTSNEWIRHKVNFTGFEKLWYDFKDQEDKLIIKDLISVFYYLSNEDAEEYCEDGLKAIIKNWNLNPVNTLFVATQLGTAPDGSEVFIGFIKSILRKINNHWMPKHLLSSIKESKEYLNRLIETGKPLRIKKIILVDDFVGTGKTANERIEHYKKDLEELNIDAEVYFFSLAGMKSGVEYLEELNKVYHICIKLEKGLNLLYDSDKERNLIRSKLVKMESILSEKLNGKKLSDHSLGWGKSEALYSWVRNNIPNNVFPIFWWSKYRDDKQRKTMFNRMQ